MEHTYAMESRGRKRLSLVKKPADICRKHPKHQQSPGVCSLCLAEQLSKISSTSHDSAASVAASSSSSLSYVSSVSSVSRCSSNAATSPMHRHGDRPSKKGYLSGFLRKSRSMAFVSEKINMDDDDYVKKNKKKKKGGGFWSKLMGLKRSVLDKESSSRLMHSRTMREMLTTKI